jgi:hypothetical protein
MSMFISCSFYCPPATTVVEENKASLPKSETASPTEETSPLIRSVESSAKKVYALGSVNSLYHVRDWTENDA